jgi:hypothetical protein
MLGIFGFIPVDPHAVSNDGADETLAWIAFHCRQVSQAHMALAVKAEELMNRMEDNRKFRTGLRTFARHHRQVAWQHLEMARRAEAARHGSHEEFDLADVVSA